MGESYINRIVEGTSITGQNYANTKFKITQFEIKRHASNEVTFLFTPKLIFFIVNFIHSNTSVEYNAIGWWDSTYNFSFIIDKSGNSNIECSSGVFRANENILNINSLWKISDGYFLALG